MSLLARLLLLTALLFGASPFARADAPAPPPDKLLKALARGVNLSIWFTYRGQEGIDPQHWYPTADDWRQIKALGLGHVRVQFDPAYFTDPATPGLLRADRLAELKQALGPAWDHGLVVVLAAEPSAADKARLVKDEAGVAELARFWYGFAQAMKTVKPSRLVFELLNEPTDTDAARNRVLMQRLVDAVRTAAPRHTLVVEGHAFSGIDELLGFEPLPAANLIYGFHFYEPSNFTHQGAPWGWPMWTKLKGLPYPSSPEAVQPALQAAEDDAKPHIAVYGEQQWNRARIEARLDLVRDWQQARGVPVWCSEFGAANLGAPAESRHQWLQDVRTAFEARHMAWTLFDFVGHFGLFTGDAGARQLDVPAAEALGLNVAP